ncbi:MFS transporter [Arthrobacter sp. SLBN-112]|nr:MFS transporter [Arthrobacter sp. SLBN-112]
MPGKALPRHDAGSPGAVLGLRQNLAQFMLLVAVNALVGGTLGQERTVLPLLASQAFHLDLYTGALTYILAFGLSKAAMNYFAGTLSDRYGRKPVLVAGWLAAVPVPLMLIFGPSWGWIVAANVLLGISQGLTWSTAVIMKMDLVGPRQRGLAMGFNEAAGYLGVAVTALATGYLATAYGLRPAPFLLGAAYIALGLGLTVLAVRETHHHARTEASQHAGAHGSAHAGLTTGQVFTLTSFKDRSLSAASQAGLVNNLNDGLAWGLFPVLFAGAGLSLGEIGILPPPTLPPGAPPNWSPAPRQTGGAGNGLSPPACWSRPWPWGSPPQRTASNHGSPPPSCWAWEPPWSTPPCSPPSATSPIRPGGPARWVSTGCGATADSPSVPSCPASSPTCTASLPPSPPSRRSPQPPALPSGCAGTTTPRADATLYPCPATYVTSPATVATAG